MYLRQKRKKWRQILFVTSIDCGKLKPISRTSFSNLGKTDVGKFNPKQKKILKSPFLEMHYWSLESVNFLGWWEGLFEEVLWYKEWWCGHPWPQRCGTSGRTCYPTWTADMAESLNLPTVLIPSVNTTHYLIGYCNNSKQI